MINIQGYIVDHWLGKMDADHPVLTVYDADGIYASLLPLAAERGIKVIDTTQHYLDSRMEACDYWMNVIPTDTSVRMIIYRHKPLPQTNKQLIEDPYTSFAQINKDNNFPSGPNDMYINLCHSLLHGKTQEVEKLFKQQDCPPFATVNALLDGASYPELESLTNGKSMVEVTVNLLALEEAQSTTWMTEWRSFGEAQYPNLDTNGTTLKDIQDKLWQYLLFSEFVLDLPVKLPSELKTVPVAPKEKFDVVAMVCKAIRNRNDLRNDYVAQAQLITSKLRLDQLFATAKDLGKIVTFAFENRVEYQSYIDALQEGDFDKASLRYAENKNSNLWFEADRNVADFWQLVDCCEQMLSRIRKVPSNMRSLKEVIDWYADEGFVVDYAFRKYQTKLVQIEEDTSYINDLSRYVYARYRKFTEDIQTVYQDYMAGASAEAITIDRNTCFWDNHVMPALRNKKKVVVVMADAFRYEMGQELKSSLSHNYAHFDCVPSVAFLPTITRFGMAALLPNAYEKLELKVVGGKLQPVMDGKVVETPDDRIEYIKSAMPASVHLQDFSNDKFSLDKISADTNLLIIRSTKIDSSGESIQTEGLTSMDAELRSIVRDIRDCKKAGFDTLFIVADHGFMIQPNWQAGDNMQKPTGNKVLEERRCVAGDIASTPDTIVFTPEELGLKTDVFRFAFARRYGVFTSGKIYFHEGISLQENIVPIVTVQLSKKHNSEEGQVLVKLTYRGKDTGTVHILRNKIEISLSSGNLFTPQTSLRLVVLNSKQQVCGTPVSSIYYDEMSDLLTIPQDTNSINQAIDLNEDVTGDVTIQALDPETNVMRAQIILKTEFEF